jgi:colanic acid/amylovoran biosynthesis glycosyltransferase
MAHGCDIPITRKPVRVAYLVNYYPKVSHTFIRREIAALEALGHDVRRFTIRRCNEELVDEADRAEAELTRGIVEIGKAHALLSAMRVALTRPRRFIKALALTLRLGIASDRGLLRNIAYLVEACILLRWLEEAKTEHLHAHFGTNATAVAMLCHTLGGPGYSFTSHGPEEFDKPLAVCLREKLEQARFAVAISNFGRSQLLRNCDHPHWSKVHVVHCGLDAAFLASTPPPLPDRPRFVNIGRLSGQKGQILLLEAFAGVVAKRRDAELVIVGDGELRKEIEQTIEQLGLTNNVRVTGWASNAQVMSELEQARCLVLPSFAEGLPVVITEALALGRPVLTTYVAGIPELVSSDCGWLVPAGAVEPLTEAMLEVLDTDVRVLTARGAEGKRRVRAMHEASVEANTLGQLFRRYAST